MNNSKLVSVAIITYNSSNYIIECLDSIKNQTYHNVELIISDDCSKDNTIELCEEWLKQNEDRFVRTALVKTSINTGTAGNCNRAVSHCRGEWIKLLAGDDVLIQDCIEKNINYITKRPEASIVFSDVQKFRVENGEKINEILYFTKEHDRFFSSSPEEQLKILLNNNILPAASSFIKLDVLKNYKFNENYFCLEDIPMWISLLQNNIKIYGFNEVTAMYRIGDSLMWGNDSYFNKKYFESYIKFFWGEKIKLYRKYNLIDAYDASRKYIMKMELADVLLNNRRTVFHNIIFWGIKIFVKLCPQYKL